MDTFRSEVSSSSDALGSSRFGGSSASLSFSLSSARTTSTRSDLVSNFGQRFLERRANAKKKHEREKKRLESNQRAESAEDKRRVEREKAREARRREMEHWLPTPEALQQVERASRQRSRARMREIRDWYPLPSSEDDAAKRSEHDEMLSVFGDQPPHCKAGTRQRALEVAELERQALESGMRKRLAVLKDKVAYLETTAAAASFTSSDPQLEREAEDLDDAETRLFLAAHRRLARRHRAATALQAAWRGFLRRRVFLRWSRRRWARRLDVLSVWVMMHRVGKMAHRALLRSCLCRWRREVALLGRLRGLELSLFADAEKQPASAALPKLVVNLALASDEWASDDSSSDDGSNDGSEDEERAAAAPTTTTTTTSAVVLGGLVNAAFAAVQQAAALDGASRARLGRVRHAEARANVHRKIAQRVFLVWKRAHASRRRVALDAQLCLKRAARLFMASATTAAATGVWPREKLLAVFDMWARYVVFSRCRRTGAPLPEFAQPSAQWAVWLHNFQERQVRKVKAAARASMARQRRVLMRVRAFARSQRRKRERLELAVRHASATLRGRVLVEWRAAIADQAANKKCCRRAMEALSAYAALKRRLRPLKQLVTASATRYGTSRAWRAWGGVHLRAVCKRAWNVARIAHFPEWRQRAIRTLLVWRWEPTQAIAIEGQANAIESRHGSEGREPSDSVDSVDGVDAVGAADGVVAVIEADGEHALSFDQQCGREMRMWRVLTAWRHSTRKRGLFRSLRFHCARLRRKRLLFAVLNAWKQQVWKLAGDDSDDSDGDSVMKHVAFLEDRLAVDPWDAYRELSPMLPMLFFGYYSDAAAIFGGVVATSNNSSGLARTASKTETPAQRVYSALEVRQFHRVVAGESLAEVRNAVLRGKHLVNAADPTTGDSALHVALQGEDRSRRLEVLVLLLTEGAATHDRPNHHGLTPRQLAVGDSDAQRLLNDGVYAFFKAAAACQTLEVGRDADQVDNIVLWRVVALMLGELRREARTRADVRHDVWHSQLREEFWLRQECLRFPASSHFLSSVLRCRAYIDGMRKRICRPLKRALGVEEALTPLNPAIDAQYGELGPYARFLMAPLFEHEAAETALIHSFVGVLFSLEFPLQEAMDEAFRLEDSCAALETELSTTWEQLQRSERQLATALIASCAQLIGIESAIPLLRYFKDRPAMEYAMKRELLTSVNERRQQQTAQSQNRGGTEGLQREALPGLTGTLEMEMELRDAEGLKASAQRKLRKLVKKLKMLEDQIPLLESSFRESLVVDGRSVADICATRTKLERARLVKTSLLVKKADLQLLLSSLDEIVASIKSAQVPASSSDASPLGEAGAGLVGLQSNRSSAAAAAVSFSKTRHRLEQEMAALTRIFDAVAMNSADSDDEEDNSESAPSANAPGSTSSAGADLGSKELAATLLATIPSLQRRLEALLRDLFIANLFRTCCCWLAENMALAAANAEPEQQEDGDIPEIPAVSPAILSTSSASPTADNEPQDVALQRATRRRRTSLTNTRRVLETFQRDGTSIDMMDRDIDRMKDTYTDSASLLFKAERAAIVEAVIEQRRTREKIQSTQIITNPITGEPEEAPIHTVDPAIPLGAPNAQSTKDTVTMRRNRKKEELRHAMMLRQLDRMAVKVRRRSSMNASYRNDAKVDGTDDNVDEPGDLILPAVHGDALPLGNFIVRSLSDDATISDSISHSTPSWVEDGDCAPSSARYVTEPSMIEAMWKRGARGDSKIAKGVNERTSQGSTSVEKGLPPTPQSPTPSPVKRVLSASRRTPDPDPMMRRIRTRRSSVHGVGAFSTIEKVDGASLLQIARGQSERDVSQTGDVEDDESNHQVEGGSLSEAGLEGLSETEATAAGDDAIGGVYTHENAGVQKLSAEEDLGDRSDCLDSTMILEDDSGDGDEDSQANRSGGHHLDLRGCMDDDATLVDQHEHDCMPTVSHMDGQSTPPTEAAGADAEELDAFLNMMRSRSMSSDLGDPSSSIPTVDQVPVLHSSSVEVSDALRPQQSADSPLIVWESQPGRSVVHREHPMTVQRLPLPGSSSTRHVIEYVHPSESESAPPAIALAAQRSLGSSELEVSSAIKWKANDGDQDLSLSLHGKSLRMEGRRSRAELRAQHPHRDASDAGKVSSVAKLQTVTVGEDSITTGAADGCKNAIAVPAITVSVVAKAVAPSADMKDDSREVDVESCSEDVSTKEMAVKRGPFFVMDSDGSSSTAVPASVMEIAGINSHATALGSSQHKPLQGKSSSSARSTATTKSARPVDKVKGASSKKDELNRARTKRIGPYTSASCGDLQLTGANILTDSRPREEMQKDESALLTKLQKESVWKEFAVAPLSEAIQNAYAELYPQTYSRATTAAALGSPEPVPPPDQFATTPVSAPTSQPPAILSVSPSAAQLAVLPTSLSRKKPSPTASFELDKKFWCAVEGYRAIGSSAMIPLDEATIKRRRRDQAKGIYVSFIATEAERDELVPGKQQLEWVAMYPDQVAAIRRRLRKAPVDLFDALQQTAQLRISTALASSGAATEKLVNEPTS